MDYVLKVTAKEVMESIKTHLENNKNTFKWCKNYKAMCFGNSVRNLEVYFYEDEEKKKLQQLYIGVFIDDGKVVVNSKEYLKEEEVLFLFELGKLFVR